MATYIGLDLGGTNIKISVFDDFFHNLGEKRTPTEVRFGSEHVLNRIYDAVLALLDELHLTCQDITCMGIGVPGILDIKNGISRFSPNFPKWEEVPIVAWMESHLHIPTYIDNDARVNLYGEWKFGAGKNRNNVLMITLGTGLGGAAVIDGRVIYGATGSAGEIGHINMFREGRECRCGIIIVGGGMSRMGDRLLQYTREILDTHALRIPYGCCTIVTAVLGDAAGMLGAAVYAKEQFLQSAANNIQN